MKKILAAVVMAVIAFVPFGCGELTFEQTPYTKSDKNEAKIVEFFEEAFAGNLQLRAKYQGSSTLVSGAKTTKTEFTYIIGKIGNDNYCKVEEKVFVNGQESHTTITIYYQNTKAVEHSSYILGTNSKTKEYFFTDNINRDLLRGNIFTTLYAESFETTGHKMYDGQHYYKVTLTKDSVNDERLLPGKFITRPEDTFITLYSYEFGVNKGGYLSYFVNNYELQNSTRQVVSTFTSTIKLVPPYGSDMYIGEAPNFSDYEDLDAEPEPEPEPAPGGGES